jgi:hypothetical protein
MRECILVLGLVGCGNGFEFDFDLGVGPVMGEMGNVTFVATDGCPDSDDLFGCKDELPHFAIGAHARFVIGSTTGDAEDEDVVELARPRSQDPKIVEVGRGADGLVLVDAIAPGMARVDLYSDGDLLDTIVFIVEDVQVLDVLPHQSAQMVGAAFPVSVTAYGESRGRALYARGALHATALDGLVLEDGVIDYFSESEQFAVRGDKPGVGRIRVEVGGLADETTIRTIDRSEITELLIGELFATNEPKNKVKLAATAKVDTLHVDGGPLCDWKIVSGGGPGAALSSRVGDPFTDSLFTVDDGALAFGSGEMVVECRANDQVVGQHTIQFAP